MQDAHLAETRQSLRPIRPKHQKRQREEQQFEGGENFDSHVDRKNWTAVLQRATVKPVGSVFISQWQASWSSWYSTSSDERWCFLFPGRNSRKIDGRCRQDTHSQDTFLCSAVCSQREPPTKCQWLKNCVVIFESEKSLVIWCVTCLIHGCSLTRLPP